MPPPSAGSRRSRPTSLGIPSRVLAKFTSDRSSGVLAAILFFGVFLYLSIPLNVLTPRELTRFEPPSAIARVIKLTLLAGGLGLVLSRWSVVLVLLKRLNRFFVAFLVMVPLSFLWSASPSDTLLRSLLILTIVSISLGYCSMAWHARRFQVIPRAAITFVLLASIACYPFMPEVIVEHGDGTLLNAWRGLTQQKNQFGQMAALATVMWIQAGIARDLAWWKSLMFGGVSLACVVLSRSSTSLLSTIFALCLVLLMLKPPGALKRYTPYMIGIFTTVVLTYALAVLRLVPGLALLLEPIAAITGKDTTFSNRSVIWLIIKEHIQLHPLLGTGYGGYWIGPYPWSDSYVFLSRMYFYPTESHNGYLEIVNDLGFVGLIILIGYLVVYVRQSLQLMRYDRAQGALFIGLFFQQAIMNLSESTWLSVSAAALFTVMTCATCAQARALVQAQIQVAQRASPSPRNSVVTKRARLSMPRIR